MNAAGFLQIPIQKRTRNANSRAGAGIPLIVLAIVAGLGVVCLIVILLLQYLEFSFYEKSPSVWVKPGEITALPPMPIAVTPIATGAVPDAVATSAVGATESPPTSTVDSTGSNAAAGTVADTNTPSP